MSLRRTVDGTTPLGPCMMMMIEGILSTPSPRPPTPPLDVISGPLIGHEMTKWLVCLSQDKKREKGGNGKPTRE